MTTALDTIERRAAIAIATRFFIDATFMPRVGNPVSCKAYVAREQDIQPIGYHSVGDIQLKTIVYLKEQVDDSVVEPGAYFMINSNKYTIEAPAENDGNILGRVVIRDEN